MSKLWAFHPKYLDDARLLREHQSIHGLLNQIIKKTKRSTARYLNYGGYLVLRHYLAVEELRARGMHHQSFLDKLWKQLPKSKRLIRYKFTNEDIIKDVQLLRHKQHSSRSSKVSVVIKGLPKEVNEIAERVNKQGFPKDIFLI